MQFIFALAFLAVWRGVKQHNNFMFSFLVCFMSTHYQVFTTYTLTKGKPQLVNISYHSTKEYFPFIVRSYSSILSQSRYYYTQKEAKHYIGYFYSRYPNTAVTRPILDTKQYLLF